MNTVIGHLASIAFYFNEPMDKASVESAFRGLPDGTFTWNDDATVVFRPSQLYSPNSRLSITIASSIKSANGFGIEEPIDLSFTVADYLRAVSVLPKDHAGDVSVDSAVAVSFNQPVVPLGGDGDSMPAAFSLQPSVPGRAEWINTSTYIFYRETAMAGGTEYTISLTPDLQTETGAATSNSADAASRNITILALVGGSIMLTGLWLLIAAIRPMDVLTRETLRIADNDLTGRVPQTGYQDEVGRLATAIAAMQGQLTRRIQEIAGVSQQINAAVETMTAGVEHTSMGVQQQHSETEQVATAMNEMTATVHEVARNTAAAAKAACQADQEVGTGSQVVKQTIASIGRLADEVRKGADAIARL